MLFLENKLIYWSFIFISKGAQLFYHCLLVPWVVCLGVGSMKCFHTPGLWHPILCAYFLFRKRFSFGKFEVKGRKFKSQLLCASIFNVALVKISIFIYGQTKTACLFFLFPKMWALLNAFTRYLIPTVYSFKPSFVTFVEFLTFIFTEFAFIFVNSFLTGSQL